MKIFFSGFIFYISFCGMLILLNLLAFLLKEQSNFRLFLKNSGLILLWPLLILNSKGRKILKKLINSI